MEQEEKGGREGGSIPQRNPGSKPSSCGAFLKVHLKVSLLTWGVCVDKAAEIRSGS